MIRWIACFVFVVALVLPPPLSLAQTPNHLEVIPGEIVIKVYPQTSRQRAAQVVEGEGGTVLEASPNGNLLRVAVEPGHEQESMTRLGRQNEVEFATYNYRLQLAETPNDPDYDQLWGLNNTGQSGGVVDADIDAPEAWEIHTGDNKTVIAIVDTGVDLDHPDLQANLWQNEAEIADNGVDDDNNGYIDDRQGWDFADNDKSANDDNGHGTHVAGIAAAVGDNGLGVTGVSWRARIMPLKMLDSGGNGSTFDLAQAVYYAADNGAQIINMSLGGTCGSWPDVEDAVSHALSKNVLVVAASGNQNSAVFCPAAFEGVMAVGATNRFDARWFGSNYGDDLDVVAPGESIYSTTNNGQYGKKTGTSMATPYVSGLAALIWSYEPALNSYQVGDVIRYTSDDLGAVGKDIFFGYGRINAWGALDSLSLQTTAEKTLLIDDTFTEKSGLIELETTNPGIITWSATISPTVPWLSLASPASGSISPASSPAALELVATQPLTYGTYSTRLIFTGTTSAGFPTTPRQTDVNLIYVPKLKVIYVPFFSFWAE